MKRFFYFLLFVTVFCFIQKTYSQSKVELFIGGGSEAMIYGNVNTFMSGYNEIQNDNLKSNMGGSGIPLYYQFGVNFWFQKLGVSISTSTSGIDFRARFKNNTQRDLYFINHAPIELGIMMRKSPKSSISLKWGWIDASLISQFIYADGTSALTNNNSLNGVFDTFGSVWRLDYNYEIKQNLNFRLGLTWYTDGREYFDKSYGKGLASNDYFYFPDDYKTFYDLDSQGKLYEFLVMDKNMKANGLCLNIGVSYNLTLLEK